MAKLKKNPVHYLDKAQFVISQEPDITSRGGNSAQHTAMFIIFSYSLNQAVDTFVRSKERFYSFFKLITAYGPPRLYWDNKYWPGQEGHGSRDNLFSVICGLKLFGFNRELWLTLFSILCRFGFLWNWKNIGSDDVNTKYISIFGKKIKFPHCDFCGPQMWMIAMRFKWNPLNIISDLYLAIGIYIQIKKVQADHNHTDGHLNLVIAGETMRLISSNWLLDRILRWYKNSEIPQWAFDDYFENENSAPLNYLAEPVIEKW